MRKYKIHPGFVISKNDGDRHYIQARQLMRLYKVHPKECVVCQECQRGVPTPVSCWSEFYTNLFPDFHGNYELPTPKEPNDE